ncbi:MAG: CapA family protein [Acidimicrobiales bacterium]
MNENLSDRESRIAWRLTQLVILAFLAIFVFSITDNDSDEISIELPNAALEDETELTNNLPIATDEMKLTTSSTIQNKQASRSFTFIATGELLIHEFVADAADSYGSIGFDFSPMFKRVAPIISGADLAICHLETPLSTDNSVLEYYPTFQVPYELADAIKFAGYEGCSIASNHLLDNGIKGLEATIGHLESSGIKATGGSTKSGNTMPSLFNPGGISVAHFSYTDLMNCDVDGSCGGAILPIDPPWLVNHLEVKKIINDAETAVRDGAEFVIVSLHWGKAYSSEISASQEEVINKLLSSDSVDLIVGHGAHVIQPVLRISNKYAVAGIGNFLSNQPGDERRLCSQCPESTQDGMITWFNISEFPDGNISVTDAGYVPTWVDRSTYEIVPIGVSEPDNVEPADIRRSENRTSGVIGEDLRRLVFRN